MNKHHIRKQSKAISWFTKTGKILFLEKKQLIFYLTFICALTALTSFYIYNLITFSLSKNIFQITQMTNTQSTPLLLLLRNFSCSASFSYLVCSVDIILLLGIALIVEVFVIIRIIFLRKTVHVFSIALYFFAMQLLAIVSLWILFIGPSIVVNILSAKADMDIQNSVIALNNSTTLHKIGTETVVDKIAEKISSSSDLKGFSITELNPTKGAVLSYLKVPKTGRDNLYNASILPYELSLAKNRNKKISSHLLLFTNNTLVINNVDRKTLEKLVSLLADKMIRTEFKKDPMIPKISFLNDTEYNIEQKKQAEALLKKQRDYISYLQGFVSNSDNIIQKNQNIINTYQADKQNAQTEYDNYIRDYGNWYVDCKAQLGNDPLCEKGKNKIDENLNILRQNIQIVEDNKKQAEENIALQTQYKQSAIVDLAKAKQNYQEAIDNPITPELQDGVFDPPNLIFVRYYDNENKTLSFYLDTTLHEYLHFYSSSETKNLDTFLEEGITDYLKIQILSKYLEPESLTLGYPDEVEVMATLVKYLPKVMLTSYYFNKDQKGLEAWFNATYDNQAYQSFIMDGKAITYAPIGDEKTKQRYVKDMETLLAKKGNFSSVTAN